MPQMFDWIFFAIILPVPLLLAWDYHRNRSTGDPTIAGAFQKLFTSR